MTNVKGFSPDSGSAPAELPRRIPGASGHKPAGLAPRPTPPAQRLHASMNPLLRGIDWSGHMPTAPRGPVSMTRAQVTEQLAATASDDNERVIPNLPGPRRSPETPQPKVPGQRQGAYERELLGFSYGEHAANAAFGSAA